MLPEHINIQYIADHITRIETRHAGKPQLIADSLYRIASNADILKGKGSVLTPAERQQTLVFIEEFKSSPEGAEALQNARETVANRNYAGADAEHLEDLNLMFEFEFC